MSSFPLHEKNIARAKSLGINIEEEDNYDSWDYDELTYILSDALDEAESLQQQNTALQQQVKELQAENKEWESLHKNSLYGTMGELKAAAIIEAMQGAPCNNESHDEIHRYIEEYANTLSSKGGD